MDTNVFVSSMLWAGSVAERVIFQALKNDLVLMSRHTLAEMTEVLQRPKFAKQKTLAERQALLAAYAATFTAVEVMSTVMDSRDPRDNMFLQLALSGRADVIVTGDDDLLRLHPWRGIAILSPADYLAEVR